MVTDPISDLLVRLQNASRAGHTRVSLPLSRIKFAIAQALEKAGYVGAVDTKNPSDGAGTLTIDVAYKNGRPVISGIKRVSKPSRRMYLRARDLRPIKRGYGLLVLSTPEGVLTGKEAREKKVGGEALFEIW